MRIYIGTNLDRTVQENHEYEVLWTSGRVRSVWMVGIPDPKNLRTLRTVHPPLKLHRAKNLYKILYTHLYKEISLENIGLDISYCVFLLMHTT